MKPLTSIFNHPSLWTKGAFARDGHGYQVASASPEATCWCLTGALGLNWPYLKDIPPEAVKVLKPRVGVSISGWNDAEDRTFADVRALAEDFDKAMGLKVEPLRT